MIIFNHFIVKNILFPDAFIIIRMYYYDSSHRSHVLYDTKKKYIISHITSVWQWKTRQHFQFD